jgi:hypothetical protein
MLPKSVIACLAASAFATGAPESLYAAMCVSPIVINRAKGNGFTSVIRSRSCVGRSVRDDRHKWPQTKVPKMKLH